jgi:2-haloacid dehalogenase
MTTADRTSVIFDFGGVLVDWNPRYLYHKLFVDDAAGMERFLAEVCTSEWNRRQDAGRPLAEAAAELVAQFPAQADLIRAYYERWEEMIAGLIDGSVAILRDCRDAGHRLYGLTNWSGETFPRIRARYPLFDWFHGIVVSGEEQLVKPDRRLYACLLDRYQIDATRAVFIDDTAGNVDAAVALGMHGIHFRSPAQLREALTSLGVLR